MEVPALARLNDKLETRWDRFSALTQKLFEAVIARAQGPTDSSIALDELFDALVFRNLSSADI